VVTSVDLLAGRCASGDRVVIVGGGLVGCELAIWLARQKKTPTVVEILPQLMSGGAFVPHQVRIMTQDLLTALKVNILTQSKIAEIVNDGVKVLSNEGAEQRIAADTVVLAVGMQADNRLYQTLCRHFDPVYRIGDCRKARNVMHAVWDAYEIGRSI